MRNVALMLVVLCAVLFAGCAAPKATSHMAAAQPDDAQPLAQPMETLEQRDEAHIAVPLLESAQGGTPHHTATLDVPNGSTELIIDHRVSCGGYCPTSRHISGDGETYPASNDEPWTFTWTNGTQAQQIRIDYFVNGPAAQVTITTDWTAQVPADHH